MPIKSKEEHLDEAKQELDEMEQAAEKQLPGVLDLLEVMDRFDSANEGTVTYAEAVESAVYFTADNTSGK